MELRSLDDIPKRDGVELQLLSLFDLPEIAGANLQSGFAVFPEGLRQPEENMAPHEEYELSIILSGSLEVETAQGKQIVGPGTVSLIPPGEAHAARALEPSSVFYVLYG